MDKPGIVFKKFLFELVLLYCWLRLLLRDFAWVIFFKEMVWFFLLLFLVPVHSLNKVYIIFCPDI